MIWRRNSSPRTLPSHSPTATRLFEPLPNFEARRSSSSGRSVAAVAAASRGLGSVLPDVPSPGGAHLPPHAAPSSDQLQLRCHDPHMGVESLASTAPLTHSQVSLKRGAPHTLCIPPLAVPTGHTTAPATVPALLAVISLPLLLPLPLPLPLPGRSHPLTLLLSFCLSNCHKSKAARNRPVYLGCTEKGHKRFVMKGHLLRRATHREDGDCCGGCRTLGAPLSFTTPAHAMPAQQELSG